MAPQQVRFPGALLTIPTISNVLKRYRFFRSDVTVEIKLNSTPFHQGALIVAWIPCSEALPAITPGKWPFFLSGIKNHVIINASTQDSVKMTIPWLTPLDWYDSAYMTTTLSSIIGSLYIIELNALVATSIGQVANVPVNVFASFTNPRVTGFTSDSAHNVEAAAKAIQGLDAKSAVSAVSKILRKVPVVGSTYGLVADAINSFAGDLSKPVDQQASQFMIVRTDDNFNQSNGLTQAKELTLYHNSQVASSPVFENMETCHATVSQLAQMPMLYALSTLSITNASINIPVLVNTNYLSTPAYTQNTIGDWLTFVSRAHKYWRGSIKYLLHINVPAFYSFRLRVTLRYKNAYSNLGDLQSTVYDIKGETFIDISIPYLYSTMYRQPAQEAVGTLHPWISLTMETPIVGSASLGSPFAYVNIYRAAGEDTQFAQLCSAQPSYLALSAKEKEKLATSDSSPFSEFARPFKTLIPGVTQAQESRFTQTETTVTVADCLKRPSAFTPTSTYTPLVWTLGAGNANYINQAGEPYNYFSSVYLFRRGGILWGRTPTFNNTISSGSITTVGLQGRALASSPGSGVSYPPSSDLILQNSFQKSVIQPYFANMPWVPNNTYGYNYSPELTTDGINLFPPSALKAGWPLDTYTYIAAVDDTLLMFPIPLFPYYFGPSDFSGGFVPVP